MNQFVKFYHYYSLPKARVARVLVFFILFLVSIFSLAHNGYPRFSLFLLSIFFMLEIFFREKILKQHPEFPVINNPGKNLKASATMELLETLLFQSITPQIISQLLLKPQILFLLEKAGIAIGEIKIIDIPRDQLLLSAFDIAKHTQGTYMMTIDVFAAYLLLTESQTHLIFQKKLKDEEFMQIVMWGRKVWKTEELPKQAHVQFDGEGIAEDWNTGWTPETNKYVLDFTKQVLYDNPLLLPRDKEYQQLVEVLASKVKNSVILIGDPGVGKTSLVAAFSLDSFTKNLPGTLYHQKIYQLMVGSLVAGTTNAGELETRLQSIMEELSHAGNIILFIPEMENMVGSSTSKVDLSGAFFPFLKNGSIRIIAGITDGAYKEFIEPKASFSEVFEPIHIEEPDRATMMQLLLQKAPEIEKKNKVSLTYKALVAAMDYSRRFLPDHALPGSAITLLNQVASHTILQKKTVIDEGDVIRAIEEKTHITLAQPENAEKDLLLHLEDKLHERVIDQEDAIHAIAEALRRIRSGMNTGVRPISFLFLGPTGVGKTETARALASLYFHGEDHMIRLDMSEYTAADSVNRLLGAASSGGEDRGELTEKIKEHPFSLVLLDEFEKAHPDILNLFLQVLEDGRLTDSRGKTVSFVNSIIIATSNAGSEFIREELAKGVSDLKKFQQDLLDLLQTKAIFKPELLNRFDDIIAFHPLGVEEVRAIVKLLLQSVTKELAKQDIGVSFDQSVIEKIVKEGFDAEFGARPLRRYIQHNIEDILAQKILRDELKRGANVVLKVDEGGNIILG